MDEKEEPPSAKALDEGYNQTYLVMANCPSDSDAKSVETDNHEVFFRCGNWCYKGQIQFGGVSINTEELPILIPMLQRQQGSLRYFCNSKSVPQTSEYSKPLIFLEESSEFIAQELLSDSVDRELRKMANVFPWIDDDKASSYFELSLGNVPEYMKNVSLIASKTYTRGLIVISIFFDGVIYFVIQGGEGDQALLDVRFPDVSQHGQGLHLNSYNDHTCCYRKLTLWHVLSTESTASRLQKRELPKIKTLNVSSKNYQQTYCILKSSWDNNSPVLTVHHDVLFRFGSWCYCGRVQLTPAITLSDIPFVIPALRMQQSRLDFLCDVSQVPTTSPFASALAYVQSLSPLIEDHIEQSEVTLKELIDRLTGMGLGDSVSRWLEGDPANSFFEFKVSPDSDLSERFKNVELVVSKCYHPSGVISIIIIFQFNIYVSILENSGESPLLDSRFPDVSGKGRGYQLQAYNNGTEEWPTLRKISIWQTVGALEQEFRDKATTATIQSQSKLANGSNGDADAITDSVSNNNSFGSKISADDDYDEDGIDVAGAVARNSSMGHSYSNNMSGSNSSNNILHNNNNIDSEGTTSSVASRAEEKLSSPSATASGSSPTMASRHNTGSNSNIATSSNVNSSSGITTISSSALKPLPSHRGQALPHHIPKLDSLSNRMSDIRKNMGEEGLKAPWDSKGRPLGNIGNAGKK